MDNISGVSWYALIKNARKIHGYKTQRDFYHAFIKKYPKNSESKVNLSESTYKKLESGHLNHISDSLLSAITDFLGLSIVDVKRVKEGDGLSVMRNITKYAGHYLMIGYSYREPEHLAFIHLHLSQPNVLGEMQARLESDIGSYNFIYEGTTRVSSSFIHMWLRSLSDEENIFCTIKTVLGMSVKMLEGISVASTISYQPYSRRIALLKIDESIRSDIVRDICSRNLIPCSKFEAVLSEVGFGDKEVNDILRFLNQANPEVNHGILMM